MTMFQRYARATLTLLYVCAVIGVGAWISTLLTDSSVPGILLANTFATPSWVMRKVARRLVNNCVFAGNVMRDYDDEYQQKGVKMGDTITLRLPQRYQVSTGAVMNPTTLTDHTVTLTITDPTNIRV